MDPLGELSDNKNMVIMIPNIGSSRREEERSGIRMTFRKRTFTKCVLVPAMIIALAVAFTPVLNFAGLGVDNAYAAAKIAAPKNVKAEATSTTAIKVTWGKSKGAKGYKVYMKKGSKFKAVKTTKARKYTAKKLNEDTEYTFYVKAFKKKGKKKIFSKASKKVTARTQGAPIDDALTAVCKNGQFVGVKDEAGVISYKGIPYAKAPVGDLRWQLPEAPDASDEVIMADEFGHPSVQGNYPLPEPSTGPEAVSWAFDPVKYTCSEDCLTLNVWTKDTKPAEKKPVMVWFHGGGFVVGSTTNDAYQLNNFANREDIVMVSANYRLGMFGSMDMSEVPDGDKFKKADFKDSQNLSLRDFICALEWVQENIEAFGGDPNNVTIFGNSAGAAYVTLLTTANNDKVQKGELFQRVIAQSGSLSLCVPNSGKAKEQRVNETALLMKLTGAKNLDDLMELSEEQIIRAYTGYYTNKDNIVDMTFYDPSGEEFIMGTMAYDDFSPVYGDDAGLLPDDPYQAVADGAGKNIDVMYGTNQNEWNYWIYEMAEFDPTADHPVPMIEKDYEDYVFGFMPNKMTNELGATITDEEMTNNVQPFLALERVAGMKVEAKDRSDDEWKDLVSRIYYMPKEAVTDELIALFKSNEENYLVNTELYNDLVFRVPATKAAADHAAAGGTGKTYMYYWCKETGQPYQLAGHASEISYVFGNPSHTCFSGVVDMGLSNKMSDMWANFARTGDPSIEGANWTEYEPTNRATMTMDLDDDLGLKMVNDPLKEQRELMEGLLKYHLK